MRGIFIGLFFLLSVNGFAQITGNSIVMHDTTNTALSTIVIEVEYEADSVSYHVNCEPFEGKDAFEIQVNKYKGLRIEFHRPMGGTLLAQELMATNTAVDIKTVFSGTYYLDVYNESGEKIKTFRVEKRF